MLQTSSWTMAVFFWHQTKTLVRQRDLKKAAASEDGLEPTEFLGLQRRATFVITDSGGVQEETTFLGVPCLTVRDNTKRPITVTLGTNILVGRDMNRLKKEVRNILSGNAKAGTIPPLWDGRAGERIADVIVGKG